MDGEPDFLGYERHDWTSAAVSILLRGYQGWLWRSKMGIGQLGLRNPKLRLPFFSKMQYANYRSRKKVMWITIDKSSVSDSGLSYIVGEDDACERAST